MQNFRNIFILIIALIMQVSLSKILPISWEIYPNLVLIIILIWCLLYDYPEALFWAFIGGFFLELYAPYGSAQFYCANIIAVVLVVTIANCVLHYLIKEINYVIVGVYAFLATVLFDILQFALKDNSSLAKSGFLGEFFRYNFKLFVIEGILNIFFIILAVYFLKRFKNVSIENFG